MNDVPYFVASPNSTSATDEQDSYALYAESDGKQEIIQFSEWTGTHD